MRSVGLRTIGGILAVDDRHSAQGNHVARPQHALFDALAIDEGAAARAQVVEHVMAEAEPIGTLRSRLLELAADYDELAERLEISRDG